MRPCSKCRLPTKSTGYCPPCHREWAAQYPLRAKATGMVSRARSRAQTGRYRSAPRNGWERLRVRPTPFDHAWLTVARVEEWLQEDPTCRCCHVPLRLSPGQAGENSATLDRINPARGYVAGNVWVLCMRCNRRKSDADESWLLRMVVGIQRHRARGSLSEG